MWSQNRHSYREYFYATWNKHLAAQVLTPLESELVQVILKHPEYHFIFTEDNYKEKDYFPDLGEANPFLHLSLHLGLREQLKTDRPAGIRQIFENLLAKYKDPHQVEHLMMDQIGEMMHRASRGTPLDDQAYLAGLKAIP